MTTTQGLTFSDRQFLLRGQPFQILSGSIHYFRVVPAYWWDRLSKAKTCGLNTIDTYVPWNLHEPKPGHFISEGILDIRAFIKMAAQLEMYLILRPGPYICAEWEFGGLPSWLLADPNMEVRSNYPGYQEAVKRYFGWLLPLVQDLQFSSGGPIIAVQVENEFGSFNHDDQHMQFIKKLLCPGITELLLSSDNERAFRTAPVLDGVLPTANGQTVEEILPCFDVIKNLNDQYPLMVMELWTGWFDQWKGPHKTRNVDILIRAVEFVLANRGSLNLYMFHGGTNFGFMAGALNLADYKSHVTSYDYDAPLTEDGQETEKYWKLQQMFFNTISKTEENHGEITIVLSSKRSSNPLLVKMDKWMSWPDAIGLCEKKTKSEDPQFMESYIYQNGDVQSYGYIIYRQDVNINCCSRVSWTGPIRDRGFVLMNGQVMAELGGNSDHVILCSSEHSDHAKMCLSGNLHRDSCRINREGNSFLDIVVENQGRVNFASKSTQILLNSQRKGLQGAVTINDERVQHWQVIALDFSDAYINTLSKSSLWESREPDSSSQTSVGPAFYRGQFNLAALPADYFLRVTGWSKGVVLVNGFNLGRFWAVGPQKTLYLPAPLLRLGENEILIFEEASAGLEVILDIEPDLG